MPTRRTTAATPGVVAEGQLLAAATLPADGSWVTLVEVVFQPVVGINYRCYGSQITATSAQNGIGFYTRLAKTDAKNSFTTNTLDTTGFIVLGEDMAVVQTANLNRHSTNPMVCAIAGPAVSWCSVALQACKNATNTTPYNTATVVVAAQADLPIQCWVEAI